MRPAAKKEKAKLAADDSLYYQPSLFSLVPEDDHFVSLDTDQIRRSMGRLRRGLFKRYDLLTREIILLRRELDVLKEAMWNSPAEPQVIAWKDYPE